MELFRNAFQLALVIAVIMIGVTVVAFIGYYALIAFSILLGIVLASYAIVFVWALIAGKSIDEL